MNEPLIALQRHSNGRLAQAAQRAGIRRFAQRAFVHPGCLFQIERRWIFQTGLQLPYDSDVPSKSGILNILLSLPGSLLGLLLRGQLSMDRLLRDNRHR